MQANIMCNYSKYSFSKYSQENYAFVKINSFFGSGTFNFDYIKQKKIYNKYRNQKKGNINSKIIIFHNEEEIN